MTKNNDNGVLDWDDLSEPDQLRAQQLLKELNELFNKYSHTEEDECVDSISTE